MSTSTDDERSSILGSSAVMAAGTTFSRLSGFLRATLLAAALGNLLHADAFNIANTIPNMLYILLAGGVFNAVLVPQLVRALQHDDDGGAAYTNRIVTLAGLFLAGVTVLLVIAAPLVVGLYTTDWPPDVQESTVDFARYCLPQVFFYGMFVLVGQILNARGTFGPMMWAPIANNVVAVTTLVVYLLVFGAARESEQFAGFSGSQELLLGLGSTAGIALQLLVLLPYLRRAGFRYAPRFDFRGAGLGHTLRLGMWTVGFVIVNQAAYTVVINLASTGTAGGDPDGTGATVYSAAFLIVMVPHSIITVSLATAILPRLSARAAAQDLGALAETLSSTMRTGLAVIVPFAALLPLLAPDLPRILFGYGAAADSVDNYVATLALFGPGLVFFTVHYVVLRGFYALEQTRTVFFVQCAVGATNVVVALVLVNLTGPAATAPSLVLAYTAAYAVGSLVSYSVLSRQVGGLGGRRLLRFVVRVVLVVLLATALAAAVAWGLHHVGPEDSRSMAGLRVLVVGVVDVAAFLLLARLVRLREVTDVLRTLTRRAPAPQRD
ncbi:putative peptidoglycan biosynthesis protein MviN [Nocardioides dokdonensis FR1436]|uniref:Putative peptidoglycan biosynthesis protein MviN n=1 Tax=Nocardioides dokdonensis FR1436 TaxID=1300347 RepID=A0A1A9GHD8_9ACTN|nr:murein biosynthesis integral membrane protein MurJ [Nocardioides dokdonensis]ANH37698.1 putative peptidoglycan biosynthesis protein MviN [Nocardioides dokdonensis FR1436]